MATTFYGLTNDYGDLDTLPAADVNALANDLDTTRAGRTSKSVAGNSDVTLSAGEYETPLLILTGTLTGNINVIVPVNGWWLVHNNTAGAFTLTMKTSGGTGITITQGYRAVVYADGTNVVRGTPDLPVSPAAYTQTYSTADRTLAAYTADNESGAYTGIDNAQAGTVYAQLTDLNALRVAYENLRALAEDTAQMLNAVVDDLQAADLLG